MEQIKAEYGGIEIKYVEEENVWRFELRGRERKAESLAKAKEAIDKPLPSDKKPFQRIKAYKLQSGLFEEVEITSIAETTGWRGTPEFWISGNGKREKVDSSRVFAFTPENAEKISAIRELNRQRQEAQTKIDETQKSMAPVDVSNCA